MDEAEKFFYTESGEFKPLNDEEGIITFCLAAIRDKALILKLVRRFDNGRTHIR